MSHTEKPFSCARYYYLFNFFKSHMQCSCTVRVFITVYFSHIFHTYTAILRKVVGKSARDNPVWEILSTLFFKEI